VLYSFFPAPAGQAGAFGGELVESSHYADEFLPRLRRHMVDEGLDGNGDGRPAHQGGPA
jgi:hypothetical protein